MRIGFILVVLATFIGTVVADDRPMPASWALERAGDIELAAIDRVAYGPLDID